ncbi:nuclear transport factor 2 family protein [Usitatibacter palustris]|uniref:DUF4440 domain-containing protein n=1 Tax=Usitatibacter palustris TaxID=2732487 RepID=A0A6M4H8Z9_9PROT|nr:nuclear transport factor 2 family protein [Usitatibacter palustris]QJR14854.1 hypothetical protein DSM104440_01669 [Usitatibacter palustris]
MINHENQSASHASREDHLRHIERSRLKALVDRDVALAQQLHSPEFQLVTPGGGSFTREQYLGKVEKGTLRYLRWEPGPIAVRMHDTSAVLRYQATLELEGGAAPFQCWHIDTYELRDSHWEVVWSQATKVAPG